jgi:hypothetical protein
MNTQQTAQVTAAIWDSRTSWRVEFEVAGRFRSVQLTDAEMRQAQSWGRGHAALPFPAEAPERAALRRTLRYTDTSRHVW